MIELTNWVLSFLKIMKMIYTNLFQDYLKFNRWLSDFSIYNYKLHLWYFDEYLKRSSNYKITVEDCEKITRTHIESFMAWEVMKKSARTVNLYLSAIKQYLLFCEWLWKKVINVNTIKRIKEYRRKIEALEWWECKVLLDYFKKKSEDTSDNRIIYKRNYCIAYLLLYTGLRLSELQNLKRSDVKEYMVVRWKGNKNRTINLFEDDLEVINDYLCLRKDDSEWLFVSFSNNHYLGKLSKTVIEEIIREWWKCCWLKVFPHKLRHSFATNLLRKNASLIHIQQLLWHSSLATTEIYLTVLNRELRDTQKLLHW